jgi:hypothetical protein
MTDEELFDKIRTYNAKLAEYGWRKQLHSTLGSPFPEEKTLGELEDMLSEIAGEFHRRREKARAEGA